MASGKQLCFLAAGALLLGGLGCSGGLVRANDPSDEVLELRRQIHELQRQARVDEVHLARLQEEIAALEKEVAAARDAADRDAPVRASREPDREREAFPPREPEIEETELADRDAPAAVAPPATTLPPTPPASTPPRAPEVAPPAAATEEALRLYDEGYSRFHQQRYEEAEERFRRYLMLYPETDLADNAQFWIGECHYARGDFAAALEAFTSTVELYPQGNKVADALLKAGKCLEELGEPAAARQTYREITDRFPSSSAAAVARERLTTLK